MVHDTVSAAGVLMIGHDAREALEVGTFDRPGRHLSRNLFAVDEEGWRELQGIFDLTLMEVRGVEDAVPYRGRPTFEVVTALMLFQTGRCEC